MPDRSNIQFTPSDDNYDTRDALAALADRFAATHLAAHLPCAVRVSPDRLEPAGRHVLDAGRVGTLASVDETDGTDTMWAYVVGMSPGEDGNPSRYLSPRNLLPVRTPGATFPTWSLAMLA